MSWQQQQMRVKLKLKQIQTALFSQPVCRPTFCAPPWHFRHIPMNSYLVGDRH